MERLRSLLFQLMVALGITLLLFAVPQAVKAEEQAYASTTYVTMYRLYNPNSGEHLYTKDSNEVSVLTRIGWKKEGEAWKAATTGTAVYRLYNPNNGDHHYTLDKNEYNTLGKIGWRKEGIAWYSDKSKGVAVYRLFNPSQTGAGSHHYTTDKNEYKVLKTKGWRQEGIAWYGVKIGNNSSSTSTTTNKPKAKYSYELYTTVSTIYSGYEIPIFIKTDNPEYFFPDRDSYTTSTGIRLFPEEYYSSGETFRLCSDGKFKVCSWEYDDVQYLNDKGEWGYYKVDGGYLTTLRFEEAGTYSLYVNEYINGTVLNLGKVTVTVKDSRKSEDQWQYSVINQVTTDAMDPFEKMDAIRSYLLHNFKYYKNDGHYYNMHIYDLIADAGKPYFETKEWDSAVSPAVLCEIAEKVGGFDDIHNCFGDYASGTSEWDQYHPYARLTIGDEVRYYSACPAWSQNIIESVDRFNLLHSNLLKKL